MSIPNSFTGEIIVRRVRLDASGYARKGSGYTGQYFGLGPKVWCLDSDEHTAHIRAHDKSAALARARADYPKAKVRR